MKKIVFFSALFFTIASFAQKTIRDANAVTRTAKNYHAIEVSAGIDLYLSQSSEEAVAVSASGNEYRDNIQVQVIDGVLHIGYRKQNGWGVNWGNRKMKAYVAVKNLDAVTASGGSDVFVDNELNMPSMHLHLSGGSDFKGRINTKVMSLSSSGGSGLYISGRTEDLKIEASGGSDVHAYDLISDRCQIQSSGGSDIKITVNKTLTADASGGSDVYYKCNATLNALRNGHGSVKKVN